MYNKLCLCVFLLFTMLSFSQSKSDYEHKLKETIEKFNGKKSNEIYQLFSSNYQSEVKLEDFKKQMKFLFKEKGEINSIDLISEDKMNTYLIEFDSSSMLLILKLSKELKIEKFKIEEY